MDAVRLTLGRYLLVGLVLGVTTILAVPDAPRRDPYASACLHERLGSGIDDELSRIEQELAELDRQVAQALRDLEGAHDRAHGKHHVHPIRDPDRF